METTKHIPGPWFFDVSPDNTQAVLVDADGNTVLYLSKPFPNTLNKEVRLIAAAPELLDALTSLMKRAAYDAETYTADDSAPIWAFISGAADAIAKATGGE